VVFLLPDMLWAGTSHQSYKIRHRIYTDVNELLCTRRVYHPAGSEDACFHDMILYLVRIVLVGHRSTP